MFSHGDLRKIPSSFEHGEWKSHHLQQPQCIVDNKVLASKANYFIRGFSELRKSISLTAAPLLSSCLTKREGGKA